MTTCGVSAGALAPVTVSLRGMVSAVSEAVLSLRVTTWRVRVVPDAVPAEGELALQRCVVRVRGRAARRLVGDRHRLVDRGGAGGGDRDLDRRGPALRDRVDGGVGGDGGAQRLVGLAVQLHAVHGESARCADGEHDAVPPHLRQPQDVVDAADGLVVGAVGEVREGDLDLLPAAEVVGEGRRPQLGGLAVRSAVLELEGDLLAVVLPLHQKRMPWWADQSWAGSAKAKSCVKPP